jgi:hypothetical protein
MNAYLENLVTFGIATALPELQEFGKLIVLRIVNFPKVPAGYLQPVCTHIWRRPLPGRPPLPAQSPLPA